MTSDWTVHFRKWLRGWWSPAWDMAPEHKRRYKKAFRAGYRAASRQMQSPPRIAAAALLSNGVIYQLPPPNRHGDVMRMLGTVTHPSGTEKWQLFDAEQGFVDDAGHYLTRAQAYAVAKAAGQLIPRAGGYAKSEVSAGPECFSEDLW